MDRNSSKPNQYQQKENKKRKDSGKPTFFWVSYQDDPKEEKTKDANGDSLLERSNRFAL